MLGFYALFIAMTLINQVNSVYIYKRYQLTAGTSLPATTLYMLINGTISAIIPAIVILVLGRPLEFTVYSIVMAVVTVICAAISVILQFKAYEEGQIAIVNIMVTIGGIIIPSLWGVFFLGETMSLKNIIGIILMLGSVVLIMGTGREKINKKLIWLYSVLIICTCLVTMLSKQHQVEAVYDTVDTLSYSVWIGVVRVVLFSVFIVPFLVKKYGKDVLKVKKGAVGCASISSVLSGGAYIVTLFTATVLPVVVTSPMGTGIGILMSCFLPWLAYRERLAKKQLIGVALSFVGVLIYLLNV